MPLLSIEPSSRIGSLSDLIGIGLAMEQEAARRYRDLAQLMERGARRRRRDLPDVGARRRMGIPGYRRLGRGPWWTRCLGRRLRLAAPAGDRRILGRGGGLRPAHPYRALAIAVRQRGARLRLLQLRGGPCCRRRVREAPSGSRWKSSAMRPSSGASAARPGGRSAGALCRPVGDLEELRRRAASLAAAAAIRHHALSRAVAAADPGLAVLLGELAQAETREAGSVAAGTVLTGNPDTLPARRGTQAGGPAARAAGRALRGRRRQRRERGDAGRGAAGPPDHGRPSRPPRRLRPAPASAPR